jgi:protease-4
MLPPRLAPSGPPPTPPRSVPVWRLAVVLLSLGLGACVVALFLIGLHHFGGVAGHKVSGRVGVADLRESVLEDNRAKDKVAVIEITGVISGERGRSGTSMVDLVRDQLDRAAEDEAVKAVVLRVDSPGGEVLASDEIYDALRAFQTSNNVPVVASMGSLAASGGYYVSAPCRWIVAHPLTLTGSIGVIFHGYNYRGLMDKVGVRPDIVKSGKLKDMFSGEQRSEDVLPEEKVILNDLVKESFSRFKQVVREGRGWSAEQNKAEKVAGGQELAKNWEDFADGRILSGNQALELGLVDELGSFDTAVDRAISLAGIESANVVTYESPPRLGDLLRLLGKTDASRVKVELDGLNLFPSLPSGRLYFISPLHVH